MTRRVVIYRRKKKKYRWAKGLFSLALIFFVVSLTIFICKKHLLSSKAKIYKIQIAKRVEEEYKPKVDDYIKSHPNWKIEYSDSEPDVTIDLHKKDGYSSSLIKEIPSLVLTAGDEKKILRNKKQDWFLFKKKDKVISDLENYLKGFYKAKSVINLTVVGDIIPARTVAKKMAEHSYKYPFLKVASELKKADLTLGNLECSLSDKVTPSYEGMNFVAPAATIEGLKDCGLDLVTLANNHSTNYGNEVFLDSLENLTKNNIKYVGGGTNDKEAYEPVFFDISGVRFAFLNYNSIIGGVQAGPTTPGVSWIELKPWAEIDSETSIKRMEKEVAEAKKKADVAAVCFHWGVEYQLNPIQSQIDVAHKAIESGASLIIGTHPHVVQSIEYYESPKDKNGFIAYSLGNFIFDQMWSEDTREGVILKCQFLNKDLTNLELLPYKIEDYCQPNLLDKDAGQPIIDRIFSASGLSAHQ